MQEINPSLSNKSKNMKLYCNKCDQVFDNYFDMHLHCKKNKSRRAFQCSNCSARFLTEETLWHHEFNDCQAHKCISCHARFNSLEKLARHWSTKCGQSKNKKRKKFKNSSNDILKKNKNNERNNDNNDNDDDNENNKGYWFCRFPDCESFFDEYDDLDHHYAKKHQVKKIQCQFCLATFFSPAHLNKHINQQHQHELQNNNNDEIKVKIEKELK